MNEVDKLYENAELDRNCNLYKHFTECPMKHTQCEDCENFVYPPFTAEKQLELIKSLVKNYEGIIIDKKICNIHFLVDNATFDGCHYDNKSFEESLAGVINKLWADMSEEERKQIKNILESEVRE